MPARPASPDLASFGDHAIEKDEAHRAAEINEQYQKNYADHDEKDDQHRKERRINVGQGGSQGTMPASGTGWYLEITAIASARTEFSGQKTNQCQLGPFGRAEGPQKLLFRMLKGETNGIDCGNRQADTSKK